MRAILAVLFALPLFGAAAPPPVEPVAYVLSPQMVSGALQALDVEVRFRAEASGRTEFRWADRWAGNHELWRWERDLSVQGAREVEDKGKGHWRISSAPGAPLVVRYRIVSAFGDRDPTTEDDDVQALPIVRPRWFYAAGEALFGFPDSRLQAPATFAWTGAPAGLGFASDLEHLAGPDRPALRPGRVMDVLKSISIGGRDLEVSGRVGPGAVRIATLGQAQFQREAFVTKVTRIIAAERAFWRDDGHEPFLVTLAVIPTSGGTSSTTGTGRDDAFAVWWDAERPLSDATMLIGHEYFHTWNPERLGGFGAAGSAPDAWFSEGFTDYYARALLLRAGVITPQAFADAWNKVLLAYDQSPDRTLPNAQAASGFWKSDSMGALPYQRGSMLAALWNARLRRRGGNLDQVIRDMPATRGATAALRFAIASRSRGLDVGPQLDRFVMRGAPIALPEDVFGPCARVIQQTRPVYERGFDAAATAAAGLVVKGVDATSNAYAAGLRNGMRLVARDGEPGDSMVPTVYTVDDHGVRRTIRYMPQARARERVQQIQLVGSMTAACVRTLSGLGS